MFSLFDLMLIFLLFGALYYWWRCSEQHAIALSSARKYCHERDIQLLDDTLAFNKYTLTRASNNRKYLARTYVFDFCQNGQDRHKGEIVLSGYSVIRVMLETEQLEITQY